MPDLQHYLPAAYLGGFSDEDILPARDRRVHVISRPSGAQFRTSAKNIAAIRGLYGDIDPTWGPYEATLPDAIRLLDTQQPIPAEVWLRTLVPFATCMFLRGPDFGDRFRHRLAGLGVSEENQDLNSTRLLELQCLLAPVLAARWLVLHSPARAISAVDTGWIPHGDPQAGLIGAAIPLSASSVLTLLPRRGGPALQWAGSQWRALIEHQELNPPSDSDFSLFAAKWAQRFVVARSEQLLHPLSEIMSGPSIHAPEPIPFKTHGGVHAVANEFTWHRLVGAIEFSPAAMLDDRRFDLRPEALAKGWCPPLILPTNVPIFPPAMVRHENEILVSLHQVREAQPEGWRLENVSEVLPV